MRILAITNLYPNRLQPHRGTFNRQQLRALADRHEVRVIAPIAWTDERAASRNGVAPMPTDRRDDRDGLHVEHPRYWYTPRGFRSQYGRMFRESIRSAFDRAVREFRPDLVLAAWAYPDGWAANALGHAAGLPVVVKVHGSDILTLPSVFGRRFATAKAMRDADGVIAVSQDLRRKVVRFGAAPERVTVVYDGIDPEHFCRGDRMAARDRLSIDQGEAVLLFVGNLIPVKGVDTLIKACAELMRRDRAAHCFLIGQGYLRPALERLAAELGVSHRVTFVGPVAHAGLPDWFRAADCFVLPSLSEGVPCVLLEAAACGTPFVASGVGGIPEISHLTRSRLSRPGDADSVANAITELMSQPFALAPPPFVRSHADAAAEIGAFCERILNEWRSPKPSPVAEIVSSTHAPATEQPIGR